jgi:hypothetical protein
MMLRRKYKEQCRSTWLRRKPQTSRSVRWLVDHWKTVPGNRKRTVATRRPKKANTIPVMKASALPIIRPPTIKTMHIAAKSNLNAHGILKRGDVLEGDAWEPAPASSCDPT